MSQLRFDPLGRREVLLAPERARRGAPAFERYAPDPEPCDFCGGSERNTPPETYSIRDDATKPDTPGWRVRVVPNLYPATAFHEVVVHTPLHHQRYEDQTPADQTDVLRAYRDRMRDAPTPSVVGVWNRGRAAGASRSHAHGQIFGIDGIPASLGREAEAFSADGCVLCTMSSDAALHVADDERFVVMAHPVPFVADELLIVPRHTPRIDDTSDDELPAVAEAFAIAVRRIVARFGDALPFNLVIHSAPTGLAGTPGFHWHAHLMPRIATWGGLEMGAELPIVAADPYETAERLRTGDGISGDTR